jgi:hypothetical protein
VLSGLAPFGHREAGVIRVAGSAIKLGGWVVTLIDFEMNGIHPELKGALFHELHGSLANSLPTILRLDIEFIDKRTPWYSKL